MDSLSLFGVIVALVAIGGGQYFEGGQLHALLNGPAFLIVMGGTLGAVFLQTRLETLTRAFRIFFWVFFPPRYKFKSAAERFVNYSKIAQRSGLLELEKSLSKEKDKFILKSINILLSGVSIRILHDILETEIDTVESKDLNAANVFFSMGSYSPTIGIVGAVLGLIQVMRNLTDPSQLGMGIAIAFVATVYGVGLANLVFLPIAHKLKYAIEQRSRYNEMIMMAVIAIAEAEQPMVIQQKLASYCVGDELCVDEK